MDCHKNSDQKGDLLPMWTKKEVKPGENRVGGKPKGAGLKRPRTESLLLKSPGEERQGGRAKERGKVGCLTKNQHSNLGFPTR